MQTVLSGIRSTGHLHLGNYFGALRNFVRIQDDYNCYYFIADLHSLTTHPHPDDFHANVRTILAEYLAAGLDPDVPEVSELYVLLNMISYKGELERTTTFKDKVRLAKAKARNVRLEDVAEDDHNDEGINISAGLLTYPVLMAADILIHRADFVPVGKDQEQHTWSTPGFWPAASTICTARRSLLSRGRLISEAVSSRCPVWTAAERWARARVTASISMTMRRPSPRK